MPSMRLVEWIGEDDRARLDAVAVELSDDRLMAIGTSRAADYVLSWSLSTCAGWVTDSLQVTAHGAGWARSLSLLRADAGDGNARWSAEADHHGLVDLPEPGLTDPAALVSALDCDLGRCPLTNTMPIRRLRLLDGGAGETELVMAWVEVPSLRVLRSDQVYSSGRPGTVLYRSRSRDYTGQLEVDADGLVTRYPGLARRIVLTEGSATD